MVPHLLRVRRGEAPLRRPAVAIAHRDGPLLRERAAPDVAGLVRPAASPARVPRLYRGPHLRVRAGDRLVRLPAAPVPVDLLLPLDGLPGGDHPHRELRVPELHRAVSRGAADRRPLSPPAHASVGAEAALVAGADRACLLYTSPSPRDS